MNDERVHFEANLSAEGHDTTSMPNHHNNATMNQEITVVDWKQIMDNLSQAIEAFVATQVPDFRRTTQIYDMDFSIEPLASFPSERFAQTIEKGILYRPEIVDEIEAKLTWRDVFVRGAPGIGKSHSLVNLVRSLRAKGYIVTFLPDCGDWQTDFDLWDAMCRSIGSSPNAIGMDRQLLTENNFYTITRYIKSTLLPKVNKRWIFVFDQINNIFDRIECHLAWGWTVKYIHALPYPFHLISRFAGRERINCVISGTSVCAYDERKSIFQVYDHPIWMTDEEMRVWKTNEDLMRLKQVAGNYPLQVIKCLDNPDDYDETGTLIDVIEDLTIWCKNLSTDEKESVGKGACCCLLSEPIYRYDVWKYDTKYSFKQSGGYIVPLFPSVLVAYRILFCKEYWKYARLFRKQDVDLNEDDLLEFCGISRVSNEIRGRIFELLITRRFYQNSLLANNASASFYDSDCLYTFRAFPVIDFIVTSHDGKSVWGVKTHVNDQDDILPKFHDMCESKGWFGSFANIHLVYLSPCDRVRDMLKPFQTLQERRSKRTKLSVPDKTIIVSAITVDQVQCLADLHWT